MIKKIMPKSYSCGLNNNLQLIIWVLGGLRFFFCGQKCCAHRYA
jgi:hypothetical protein